MRFFTSLTVHCEGGMTVKYSIETAAKAIAVGAAVIAALIITQDTLSLAWLCLLLFV